MINIWTSLHIWLSRIKTNTSFGYQNNIELNGDVQKEQRVIGGTSFFFEMFSMDACFENGTG